MVGAPIELCDPSAFGEKTSSYKFRTIATTILKRLNRNHLWVD